MVSHFESALDSESTAGSRNICCESNAGLFAAASAWQEVGGEGPTDWQGWCRRALPARWRISIPDRARSSRSVSEGRYYMTTMFYSVQAVLCRVSQFSFAQSPVSAGISGELIPAALLGGSA